MNPDWNLPPSETMLEIMDDLDISLCELADKLGYSLYRTEQLLNSEIPIDTDIAYKLSKVLGSTPEFWSNLDENYRKKN